MNPVQTFPSALRCVAFSFNAAIMHFPPPFTCRHFAHRWVRRSFRNELDFRHCGSLGRERPLDSMHDGYEERQADSCAILSMTPATLSSFRTPGIRVIRTCIGSDADWLFSFIFTLFVRFRSLPTHTTTCS